MGQGIIELGCNALHLWQSAPGDEREVMVLDVIANVETNLVEYTVVGVGLIAFIIHVMLRYEVSGNRMKTHGKQQTATQVDDWALCPRSIPSQRQMSAAR